MKKVALINPGKRKELGISVPFNLGFIASYLKRQKIEVCVIDELAGEDVKKELLYLKPDIIGITATTPLVLDAYEVADFARKNTSALVVMGGVHVSIMSEEALKHADIVVKGEGEVAMLDIVQENIREGIISRPYIKKLDEIPPIPWELFNINYYLSSRDRFPYTHLRFAPPNTKVASLFTSRGCPYSCIFCYNSWVDIPLRFNSSERVLSEIRYFKERYGINTFYFADDDFLAHKDRFREICEGIRTEFPKLAWAAQSMVRTVARSINYELLKLAKESGCVQLGFGFESGSERILSILKNQRATIEESKKAIKLCKKAGIRIFGTFMVGNPTETHRDIKATERFILKNKIDDVAMFVTTPFPGTKLWEWCQEKGLIPEDVSWADFTTDIGSPSASDILSREEVIKALNKINAEINKKFNSMKVRKKIVRGIRHPVWALNKLLK